MKNDHTKEFVNREENIPINELDSCMYFTPKEGSLLVVNLCAYCRFSVFKDKSKNGTCQNHLDNNGR